jgi:hypothetical protein
MSLSGDLFNPNSANVALSSLDVGVNIGSGSGGAASILATSPLLFNPTDLPRLQQLIQTNATAAGYYSQLKAYGTAVLSEPVARRDLFGSNPPRLLPVSRQVLDRIYSLGLLYRLDNDPKWRQRAVDELMAVANFADWNPEHWLSLAEMTHAVAIGYSWLKDDLTPEQRQTIKTALLDKGLRAAETAYAERYPWTVKNNNWNTVCNSGVIIGALALRDEEPDLANRLLQSARQSLPLSLAQLGHNPGRHPLLELCHPLCRDGYGSVANQPRG